MKKGRKEGKREGGWKEGRERMKLKKGGKSSLNKLIIYFSSVTRNLEVENSGLASGFMMQSEPKFFVSFHSAILVCSSHCSPKIIIPSPTLYPSRFERERRGRLKGKGKNV